MTDASTAELQSSRGVEGCLTQKVVGAYFGILAGIAVSMAAGREHCPTWRQGDIVGVPIDTEFVAAASLSLGVAGALLVGGRIGRIGWCVAAGVLTGLFAGACILPYLPALGLTGRYCGAIVGATFGLACGSIWEFVATRGSRMILIYTRCALASAVIAPIILIGLILSSHIAYERDVSRNIATEFGALTSSNGLCLTHVSCTRIDNAECRRLSARLWTLPCLDSLSLSGSQISDEGLDYIGGLQGLQSLDLSNTQVTDDGIIVYLSVLSHLESLDVRGTEVTGEGVEQLRAMIPTLRHVQFGSRP